MRWKLRKQGDKTEGKNNNTQRSFARAVFFTASINCSVVGACISSLSAPICMRRAFSSGLKIMILSSSLLYTFIPSNNPYDQENTFVIDYQCLLNYYLNATANMI